MIKFFFHQTPNPMKVALFLEESGLAYEIVPIDILKGEQHSPAYEKINPNRKVPAIVDDGTIVFDSNAILLYLAEKTGQFQGTAADRGPLLSWLMFIASGVGPYSGQAVHFGLVHTDSAYATNRYRREMERVYGILDAHLKGRAFFVGDSYTIVDMAGWGWIDRAPRVFGGDEATVLDPWPELKRWFHAIDARPAVARARNVGKDIAFKAAFDEETLRAMFPQNYPPAA